VAASCPGGARPTTCLAITHIECVAFLHNGRCDASTNLALDDELINKAKELGGHKSKKETVTVALEEYIRAHLRRKFLELEGTVDLDPAYDYKEERRRGLKRIPKWEE
jgi:Arc/MetJ family transcription regulator